MPASEPLFAFKCDIDHRFAAVRLYRGRMEWQSAAVSSAARILILGVPSVLVLGIGFGLLAAWALKDSLHGSLALIVAIAIGVVVGLVFGYRLAIVLGNAVFPTKNREVHTIALDGRMGVAARAGSRTAAVIRVDNRGQVVELRVGPGYADVLVSKIRDARVR